MLFNSITYVTLVLLLHLSTHLNVYTLEDNFTISCGTTGKSFDGERTWTGDMFLSHQHDTVSAKATTANKIPYTTARLSRSQFNYSFPVSSGPKFLRLFFYPASYPSFPRTDASFAVKANQFTLINDFNAFLSAYAAEDTGTIFREYVIHVGNSERLNLCFTPSQPNSYAFINGIEVLSMPSNLYYTSTNDAGFKLVGSDRPHNIRTSAALETAYRINVGGQAISPRNDTGLFRNWAGHDEDYLVTQNLLNNLSGDMDGKMNITVNPDYVAPKELYRTVRDMGRNTTLNKILNLTWEFPVDSGFTYMLRLHFCEVALDINVIGDRLFFIYIASYLADVMRWSKKEKGRAVYKDYAVLIPKSDTQKKVNLLLQMHPYENGTNTKCSNPFLNGLEIFKISDTRSHNLARPDPNPVQIPQSNMSAPKRKNIILFVVLGVLSCISVVFFVLVLVPTELYPHPLSFSTNTQNPLLPSDFCQRFSLAEIIAATKNFDDVFIIGAGGFGHVYKGYIGGNSTPVAIKRLKPGSQQGAREFMNEIDILSQLRHRHLVSLIGYCDDDKEMILVYEFMARGNLRDHLYNTDKPPLSWKQRLQICIEAARGLNYLHTSEKHMIIHRDVKTTNILLDDDWVAKVSDFGLSRIGPMGKAKALVSTAVKGSFGYLDPEYYNLQRLTEKSDVYSFGVVLFEILCARPPLIHTAEAEQLSLANWARHCYQSGTVEQIVDPMLKGRIMPECFKKFCDIGVSCLFQDGTQRPSMNDIVSMLEFVLQLQESAEQCESAGIVFYPYPIKNGIK